MEIAKVVLLVGITAAFLSVGLGAFGAHGLKARVSPEMLAIWQTGVTYQFFHALALILLGLWMKQSGVEAIASLWCFSLGILIFSGSLYVLVLSNIKMLGAITPIGGVFFLVGWVTWLVAVVRN